MTRFGRLLAILVSLAPVAAFGQGAVLQGGSVTPGHAPMYVTGGSQSQTIVQDSGPAAGGVNGLGISELLRVARGTGTPPYAGQGTGPLGTNDCNYDAPTNNPTGYHYLCLSANAQGGGLIVYGAGGVASQLPLYLSVNGAKYQFPFTVGGIVGPNVSVVGDIAVWNNTAGTLLKDVPFVTLCGSNIFTSSLAGCVPASGGGTVNFLRADGTFALPASNLTVGTSTITSGTTTAPLFNNAGVLGNGLITSTWSTFLGYGTGPLPRTVQAKLQDTFSVLDYVGSTGCVANQVADCSAAFNAAVTAAYNYSVANPQATSAGTVLVPAAPLCYRIATTITMLAGVSLRGEGSGSCILADNVDALTYGYVVGFGMPIVEKLLIVGENPSAPRTGIRRPGTTSDANVQYGLNIRDVQIYNFDTAVYLRTVINIWITNSWFQNINQCIKLEGFSSVARIYGTNCDYGSGGGAGASTNDGISTYQFNYTTGSGLVSPEGIEISQSQIYGFSKASLNIDSAVYVAVSNSDFTATGTDAIRLADARGGIYINNNYINVLASANGSGVHVVGANGPLDSQINIYSNTFVSGTNAASNGIQVNDSGAANQINVNITGNSFSLFGAHDILVYGPNRVNVINNYANSTTTTDSINFATAVASSVSLITGNKTAKTIVTIAGDLTAGTVRKCDNTVAGTADTCTWEVTTSSTTANRLMLGGGTGVQPSALGAGTTTTVLHGNAGGAPTFGAVSLSADVTGLLPSANITGMGLYSTSVTGVNFNAANTDTAIVIPALPSGVTRIYPFRVNITHASQTLTTATFGVHSQTAAGGAAIIADATAITISSASDAAANNAQTVATAATTSLIAASLATPNTIYFRVGTAQGSAATADVEFVYFAAP